MKRSIEVENVDLDSTINIKISDNNGEFVANQM
jgi:hypothetical protein